MLTILHGDDITKSREYFKSLQKEQQFVMLDGMDITITEITQVLSSGGLFDEQIFIAIEDLIAKKKSPDELKAIAAVIEKYAQSHTILLWESKELTKTQLGLFKKATVQQFKLPQSLFQLLDALHPKNGENLVRLFHQALTTAEVEMILFMLVRQVRLLLALHEDEAQIDEVKRMAPWQKTKLLRQSRQFLSQELLSLFKKLATIDTEMKTGQLKLPIISTIDILLLEI